MRDIASGSRVNYRGANKIHSLECVGSGETYSSHYAVDACVECSPCTKMDFNVSAG